MWMEWVLFQQGVHHITEHFGQRFMHFKEDVQPVHHLSLSYARCCYLGHFVLKDIKTGGFCVEDDDVFSVVAVCKTTCIGAFGHCKQVGWSNGQAMQVVEELP